MKLLVCVRKQVGKLDYKSSEGIFIIFFFYRGLYQELQRAPSALAFLKPMVDFTHKEIEACTEDNGLISPQSKELWDNVKKKIAILNSKQAKWPKNSNQVLKVIAFLYFYIFLFYFVFF